MAENKRFGGKELAMSAEEWRKGLSKERYHERPALRLNPFRLKRPRPSSLPRHSQRFIRKGFAQGLPDKKLVAAPIRSEEGAQYFAAMAAAANFAFNNRQQILHSVRQAFKEVLRIEPHDVCLVYDVCHNIAKFETYTIDGKGRILSPIWLNLHILKNL